MCPISPTRVWKALFSSHFLSQLITSCGTRCFPFFQIHLLPLHCLLAYGSFFPIHSCSFQLPSYCCITPTSFGFFWSICQPYLSTFFTWSTLFFFLCLNLVTSSSHQVKSNAHPMEPSLSLSPKHQLSNYLINVQIHWRHMEKCFKTKNPPEFVVVNVFKCSKIPSNLDIQRFCYLQEWMQQPPICPLCGPVYFGLIKGTHIFQMVGIKFRKKFLQEVK